MAFSSDALRRAVEALIGQWRSSGLPGREELLAQAAALKRTGGRGGLWAPAPTMVTATVDDGIGQGIDLIGRFAEALGVRVLFAGLLQPAERIVHAARSAGADLVGVTVLQLDSEPVLSDIAGRIPAGASVIAGGPAFAIDPGLADRAGVSFVAKDVAAFLRFLLGYRPAGLNR